MSATSAILVAIKLSGKAIRKGLLEHCTWQMPSKEPHSLHNSEFAPNPPLLDANHIRNAPTPPSVWGGELPQFLVSSTCQSSLLMLSFGRHTNDKTHTTTRHMPRSTHFQMHNAPKATSHKHDYFCTSTPLQVRSTTITSTATWHWQ